jgi:hypothetical protein
LRSPASCAVDGHEQGYDAIVVASRRLSMRATRGLGGEVTPD